MAATLEFPVAAFYFDVEIDGTKHSFKEVSGLEVSLEFDEIKEGGRLDYTLRVPKVTKYPVLSLKRGVVPATSEMISWVKDTMFFPRSPGGLTKKDIVVTLLDPAKPTHGEVVHQWTFYDCYPVKWSVGSLNSMENAVAIESVEFAYREFYVS